MAEQNKERLRGEIKEYDKKIKKLEKEIPSRETCEIIGDLRRKKEELQKEIRLYGIIYSKEKKIKELKNKMEQFTSEKEDLDRKIDESEKELIMLKNAVIKLEKEIEELKKKLEERDDQIYSLEVEIQENKNSHQKDIKSVKDSSAKKIQELNNKLEEYEFASKWDGDVIQRLTKANKKKFKNDRSYMLYIGQLCSDLQTNVYRYVIPKQHYVKDWSYKIKDAEEYVDSEDMKIEERKEARKKMEELKKKVDFKKLQGTIKLLQYQRNEEAHPANVDKKGALFAAQELAKQGKLKGRISIENVVQIIEFWSVLKSLLGTESK